MTDIFDQMNVVYINGSSRKGGHTTAIGKVLSSNKNVIHLTDYRIGFFEYDNSNSDDDFIPLIQELMENNVWVFLTPVYWYTMSGRMKVFFDRLTDLIKWNDDLSLQFNKIKWYALSCGSDSYEVPEFFKPIQLSADYLDAEYMGDVHVWKDKRKPMEEAVIKRLESFKIAIEKGQRFIQEA